MEKQEEQYAGTIVGASEQHVRLTLGTAPMDEDHVREMRIDIRRLKNTIEQKLERGRYLSMAFTSTEKAAMWLGVVLSVLGATYPYKRDQAIPVQDDTEDVLPFLNEKASIRLNTIREHLGLLCRQVLAWLSIGCPAGLSPVDCTRMQMALIATYQRLQEARMDLGMEVNSALKQEQIAR